MERAYIGLGSNLATPQQQLTAALSALNEIEHTQLGGRPGL